MAAQHDDAPTDTARDQNGPGSDHHHHHHEHGPDCDHGASDSSRLRLAGFMAFAGVTHFVVPGFYERVVPKWFGHEKAAVRWSGVAELLCGALVAIPRTKRLGAWLTVVTLLAVYPANIQMAIDAGKPSSAEDWAVWGRLPLQFPMLAWALRHTR